MLMYFQCVYYMTVDTYTFTGAGVTSMTYSYTKNVTSVISVT